MNRAELIRNHVIETYIAPARQRGEDTVTIRTGDVVREMRLQNDYARILSALWRKPFEEAARVEMLHHRGPLTGSNCFLTFRILP